MKKITFIFLSLLLGLPVCLSAQSTYRNLTNSKSFSEDIPVRSLRKTALSFNMGWNGLTGIGVMASFYPSPKIAFDTGLGLSGVGFKLGVRGRYLFKVKNFTPFAGIGYIYGTGTKGVDFELKDAFNNNQTFRVKIKESSFIQLVGGYEYMAKKGFFTLFDIGYAVLLNDNYLITSGNPTNEMKRSLDISYGSGIVIGGGVGFAF